MDRNGHCASCLPANVFLSYVTQRCTPVPVHILCDKPKRRNGPRTVRVGGEGGIGSEVASCRADVERRRQKKDDFDMIFFRTTSAVRIFHDVEHRVFPYRLASLAPVAVVTIVVLALIFIRYLRDSQGRSRSDGNMIFRRRSYCFRMIFV